MKICYILENFFPKVGGVETLFLNLAKGVVQNGHQVRVITSTMSSDQEHEIIDGIEIFRYKWPSIAGHSLPSGKDLYRHVAWSDLVHTTTYTAAPAAQKVCHKLRKPILISVHEVLGKRWFSVVNPLRAVILLSYEKYVVSRKYTYYHTISNASCRDILKANIPKDKIKVIYPGLDIEFKKEATTPLVDKTKRCFLFYGRWGKTKGLPVLLSAIKQIGPVLPEDVIFNIVVDEPEQVQKVINKMGLDNKHINVSASLPRREILNLVKNSFAVIVPSITEGFGFTTAESCALGTPVIGSDAGSIPEVINGQHLLFKSRNPRDLANKIIDSLEKGFDRQPKKSFTWQSSVDDSLELYSKLCRKKVGIVCDPMNLNFKGITNYTVNLVENIAQQENNFDLFLIHIKDSPLIKKLVKIHPTINDTLVPLGKFPFAYEFRKIVSIPLKIRRLDLDLIHETANAGGNMFFKNKAKQVTTVHDITPITHPEWHTFQNWLRNILTIKYTLKNSSLIITDSLAVKEQIVQQYHTERDKIIAIPLASNNRLLHVKETKPNFAAKFDKFVLSVSTIEPRKNFSRLAEAFSSIDSDYKLVIAGRWGWKSSSLKSDYLNNKFKNVIFTGEVSDNELKWLYNNASVFCMPSLDEGFGLPIIEAASAGLPVVCSDIAVFREVTANESSYFDPYDIADIKDKITIALEKDLKNCVQKDSANSIKHKYSWRKCAQQTVESYQEVL